MKEITGDLWDYFGRDNYVVLITTNGFVKKNGEAVMGRGCAFEATQRFPSIAKQLGDWLRASGNVPCWLRWHLATFPVKHKWFEKADLKLIESSARWLEAFACHDPLRTFILPRPGCGNGQLQWKQVKPLLESLPDNVWVIDFERNR